MPTLKQKLRNPDARLSCSVCTIPSATVTQALAASGLDVLIVDLEHGAVDYASAHAMMAATQGTDCAAIVRIPENTDAQVKRVLDLGAEGICFPLIKTAQDAQNAVSMMRYPPRGTRGFGPFIAQSRWGTTLPRYQKDIEDELVCCLLIETPEAVANIDAICAVEGVDVVILASFDLSTTLGVSGQFTHPDFIAAVQKVEAAANAANIPLGGVAFDEDTAKSMFERGYRLISGFDILWLRAAAGQVANWCK